MPFGLDLKSIIVGIVLALFVWPWLASFMGRAQRTAPAAAV